MATKQVLISLICATTLVHVQAVLQLRIPQNVGSRVGVFENISRGDEVFQLEARYSPSVSHTPIFRFGFSGKVTDEIFRVVRNTGSVRVEETSSIDYDRSDQRDFTKTFEVVDWGDSGRPSATLEVTFFLKDVNDIAPVFIPDGVGFTALISESATSGTRVQLEQAEFLQVQDNDTETVNSDITVICDPAKDRESCETFEVVSIPLERPRKNWKGYIQSKQTVDADAGKNSFHMHLIASDGKNNATKTIVINVIDVQDLPPKFKTTVAIDVNEDEEKDFRVGFVEAEDQDSVKSPIRYEIYNNSTTKFYIRTEFDPTKQANIGVVYTNERLPQTPISYTFTIIAIERNDPPNDTNSVTTDYTVRVKDLNTHSPYFIPDRAEINIKEDIAIGTPLPLSISVLDKDRESSNNFFSLQLRDYNNVFKLSLSNGTGSVVVSVDVLNTDLIDFDRGQRQYILNIIATEVYTAERTQVTATVTVNVLDVNDNTPIFDKDEYSAVIPEDASGGTPVVSPTSSDIDSNFFGTAGIYYTLDGDDSNLFQIDRDTGEVTVRYCDTPGSGNCIDYEDKQIYELTIVATDDLGNGNQNRTDLTINIGDINDNPPYFVGKYIGTIVEGLTEPSPRIEIVAEDLDSVGQLDLTLVSQDGQPFPIYFQLVDETLSTTDSVDRITAMVVGTTAIQYEDTSGQRGFYSLNVEVTDGKYVTTTNVRIDVTDINDNAPEFIGPDRLEFEIREDVPGGYFLTHLSAEDEDDPNSPNGKIQYRVEGGEGQFEVNEDNGTLTTADVATFNYDTKKEYTFNVIASDEGTPRSLSATVEIVVHILDANNKNPYFSPTIIMETVRENVGLGHEVVTIRPLDPDTDSILVVSFTDDKRARNFDGNVDPVVYDFTDLFIINNETGVVSVNGELDYEKTSLLLFQLQAEDLNAPGPARQIGYGLLQIRVLSVNLEAPEFRDPPDNITINEELNLNTFVVGLIATDARDSIDGFRLVEDPHSYFSLDYQTGVLTIDNYIDVDKQNAILETYIVVEVTDDARDPRSTRLRIPVYINNINDNTPQFEKSRYTAVIYENAPEGEILPVTISATDIDRKDDGKGYGDVRYRTDDPRFEIGNLDGVIKVKQGAVLDREQNRNILLRIVAYDNPNAPDDAGVPIRRSKDTTVFITLLDLNDNPPSFTQREYFIPVYETLPPGTEFSSLFATDPDESNIFNYYKLPNSGDNEDLFDITPKTARLVVKKDLRGKIKTVTFLVVVEDERDRFGNGPFNNSAIVHIDILRAANNLPVWSIPRSDNLTIFVLEEQYKGMLVYQVKAVDEDSGRAGMVDYFFLVNGNPTDRTKEFRINKVTGVIHAEIVYDREDVDRYVLLLMAQDRGDPVGSTNRFLTIGIKDVNDNRPEFPVDLNGETITREFRIPETTQPRYDVGNVVATDRDLNPRIYYQFIAGNEDGKFEIGFETGVITLVRKLDRESKSIYYLDVQATNDIPDYSVIRSRQRRAVDRSIMTVKVIVGDVNDLAPVFLEDTYYGCVSTRSSFNKNILQVQAVDRDAIGTGVVRYKLNDVAVNGPQITAFDQNTFFAIDEVFGIVTNKVLMRDYVDRTFTLTVEARDNIDDSEAEKAETNALIFVIQHPSKQVGVLIGQPTSEARLYSKQLIKELKNLTGLDFLCIDEVEDYIVTDKSGRSSTSTQTLWSYMTVSGMRLNANTGEYDILYTEDLLSILNDAQAKNPEKFDQLYVRRIEAASRAEEPIDINTALIVMIIIIILIFLIIVFAILAFACIRMSRKEKKKLLIKRQHEPVVVPEPVPAMYDNPAYKVEPAPIMQSFHHEEPRPAEPEPPIYSQVQKKAPEPEPELEPEPIIVTEVVDDDEPQVEVEIQDESPVSSPRISGSIPESPKQEEGESYRIETEVM